MNHDLKREANNFSFSDPLLNNRFKLSKQTLNELIVNCDDYGVTFISIRTIALNTGKSTPTIQKHIEILESLGVVKTLDIKGNFGKKSHRQISFNVQPNVKVDVQPNVQPNVKVDVQPNVQVAYTEEKIIQDKRREEQTATLRSAKHNLLIDEFMRKHDNFNGEGEDIKEMMQKFIKYRSQIKKPVLTVHAVNGFFKSMIEVINAGFDPDEAFEIMTENQWQTIKVEYLEKKGKR